MVWNIFLFWFINFKECLHLCREEREKIIDAEENQANRYTGRADEDDGVTDSDEEMDDNDLRGHGGWLTLNPNEDDEGRIFMF